MSGFTYDETLPTPLDRVRFGVGDIQSPGLVPDTTIRAALIAAAGSPIAVTIDAATDTLSAEAHGLSERQPVAILYTLVACGLTAQSLAYAADVSDDAISLSLTPGGAVIALTADTSGAIAAINESAAQQLVAAALAARFAQMPDQISDGQNSQRWGDRVAQWHRIATSQAGGAQAARARGARIRRGPQTDYTTGEGDA